jgi:hypothetical protein
VVRAVKAAWIAACAGDLDALAGSWSGTLTYRDYGSRESVSLASTLVVTPSGRAPDKWSFEYGYADDPEDA